MGIFTELGVLYAKYKDSKLMEHIKLFWSRLNIRKMLKACEENAHWSELTFLYLHYEEYDNACVSMMDHASEAYEHAKFKDTLAKVQNTEIFYKAIDFYLQQQPLMLSDLMTAMAQRVDHVRVVHQLRKVGHLPLVRAYLLATQSHNIKEVNDALYEIYVQEEDHESLAAGVVEFTNFDAIEMAQMCEKHQLLQFRRIGAMLYKNAKKWAQSIALSKQDKVWEEAISTARVERLGAGGGPAQLLCGREAQRVLLGLPLHVLPAAAPRRCARALVAQQLDRLCHALLEIGRAHV